MRLRLALAVILLVAGTASAHVVVDVSMSFDVPAFVPAGQNFRYRVIADDFNNDNGSGIVVTITLPSQVKFVGVAKSDTWNCSQSKLTVTCSADQIVPGPNPIDITVTAPSQTTAMHATASVQSLGSLDLNSSNDNASADVVAFEPGACVASAPALLAPDDQSNESAVVPLAWTAVPGAQSYKISTAVEGAAAAVVATSTTNSASIVAEPGRSEWWVAAQFADCPPVESQHRFFTAPSTLARPISIFSSGFRSPYGLALSPAGDMYVSDQADSVVEKLTNGQISIIAGALGTPGKNDGQNSLLNQPHGLTVTPLDGYVFAADTLNNEVRILYTGGVYVTAFSAAGTGVAGLTDDFSDKARLNAPMAVAATTRGNLYVADTGNNAIRKMTQVTGFIGYYTVSTVTTGLHSPSGIAVDGSENVFVADTDAGTILKNGAVLASNLDHPAAIAIDARGNLFVTDRSGVWRIAPSGLMTSVASGFDSLAGIAVDSHDNIYVADSNAGVIRVIKPASAVPAKRRAVR